MPKAPNPISSSPDPEKEPQVTEQPADQATPMAVETDEPPKRTISKKVVVITAVIGAFVIAGAAYGAHYYLAQKNKVPASPSFTVQKTAPKAATVTWQDPVRLADLGLVTNLNKFYNGDYNAGTAKYLAPKYYKVGAADGKDIVLLVLGCDGPCGPYPALFLKVDSNHFKLLSHHSKALFESGKYTGPTLAPKVKIDSQTSFKDDLDQTSITVNGVRLTYSPDIVTLYADAKVKVLTHFADTDFGELVTRQLGTGDGFAIEDFVLHYHDSTASIFQLRPKFISDDYIPKITWNDGTSNKDPYRDDGVGSCGSASGLAVLKSGSSDLAPTGKASTGETIYEFSHANNQTLMYFYKTYSGSVGSSAVSLSTYRAHHGVFAFKDALGRYILFDSRKYGPQVECGKPVIYLYPTSPTNVTVNVDADITKSVPLYNGGWSVLAFPNGKLVTGGKTYDSLFWEGTGHVYPDITSGFVVKRSALKTTIRHQLSQLGLNGKEAGDFMAFWMPKMPKTPYVRLTWFGTQQMSLLAPLNISPAPDTVIRIFLDFEGLPAPISLPTEHLSAPARNGFTVVEWGGLLKK